MIMISVSNQIETDTETEVSPGVSKKAALAVFEVVLINFLSQLEATDSEITTKVRQSVRTQVSLNLSSLAERQRLNSWIMGNTDKLQVNISMDDMQHCVHHAYMSACDYFGPTRADVMLANAVKASEALTAAKEFDPRNLL
jgi:hypothetical protein